MAGRIAVVGGANVDIGGFSSVPLINGDSNPGHVRMSCGGVGRNIGECCARLGLNVKLITAIGSDSNGSMILEDCKQKGIDTGECLIVPGESTSVYLYIDGADGDMHCAINDMDIQKALTPDFLKTKISVLNDCDAVVIDANLPEETIAFLAKNVNVPIFADTVSVAKAARLMPVLKELYCLKPNRIEAELLTGQSADSWEAAEMAAAKLTEIGVRNVFLTMGDKGVVCAHGKFTCHMSTAAHEVVNATGAGDAFMAALVWAFTENMDLEDTCIAGMAAASIAVEAVETVSKKMSRENLLQRMKEIR